MDPEQLKKRIENQKIRRGDLVAIIRKPLPYRSFIKGNGVFLDYSSYRYLCDVDMPIEARDLEPWVFLRYEKDCSEIHLSRSVQKSRYYRLKNYKRIVEDQRYHLCQISDIYKLNTKGLRKIKQIKRRNFRIPLGRDL